MGDKVVEILKKHFAGRELVADNLDNLAERVMSEVNSILAEETRGLCRVIGEDHEHEHGSIRLYVCCRDVCTSVDEYIVDIKGDMKVKIKVEEVELL
jgi:CMP-2-keto-3-deoxyoctulosonic acid synthetase